MSSSFELKSKLNAASAFNTLKQGGSVYCYTSHVEDRQDGDFQTTTSIWDRTINPSYYCMGSLDVFKDTLGTVKYKGDVLLERSFGPKPGSWFFWPDLEELVKGSSRALVLDKELKSFFLEEYP